MATGAVPPGPVQEPPESLGDLKLGTLLGRRVVEWEWGGRDQRRGKRMARSGWRLPVLRQQPASAALHAIVSRPAARCGGCGPALGAVATRPDLRPPCPLNSAGLAHLARLPASISVCLALPASHCRRGGYGKVHRGQWKSAAVAVKIIDTWVDPDSAQPSQPMLEALFRWGKQKMIQFS